MITAPERWPSETIFKGTPAAARSITSGASIYAAWILPAIRDSLISGQPLYFAYSNCVPGEPAAFFAVHATGSVRLHVTGKPPTTKRESSRDEQESAPNGTPRSICSRHLRRTVCSVGIKRTGRHCSRSAFPYANSDISTPCPIAPCKRHDSRPPVNEPLADSHESAHALLMATLFPKRIESRS